MSSPVTKKIVVDLGCAHYGQHFSIPALIEEYQPDKVYGFDPSDNLDERVTALNGVPVVLKRQAAWVHDGEVPYHEDGWASRINEGAKTVPCFDFAWWLAETLPDGGVVVKMDVEGAEYALLERMVELGTDKLCSELLVEWHGVTAQRADLEARLACPVREWWM